MPDGNFIDNSQPTPASRMKIDIATVALEPGQEITALVVKDLGNDRYTVDIIEQKDKQSTLSGKQRLIVSSEQKLELNSKINLKVIAAGKQALLEVIPGELPVSSNTKEATLVSFRQQGEMDLELPLTDATKIVKLLNSENEARQLVFSLDKSGKLVVKLPNSETLKPILELQDKIVHLLETLPENSSLKLLLKSALIEQKVTLTTSLPSSSPKNIRAESAFKLSGRLTLDLTKFPAEFTPVTFTEGKEIKAKIITNKAGNLTLNTDFGEFKLQIPGILGQAEGETLTVKAEAASLRLKGQLQTELPDAVKGFEALSNPSQPKVALEHLINKTGLPANTQTRSAAAALLAEHTAVTRTNIQTVIALSSLVNINANLEASKAAQEKPEQLPIPTKALQAAARQIAKDLPLLPPLTRGLMQILAKNSNVAVSLEQINNLLTEVLKQLPVNSVPGKELQDILTQLKNLPIELEAAAAPRELAAFVRTLQSPLLGTVLADLEMLTENLLQANSTLQLLDNLINIFSEATGTEAVKTAEANQPLLKPDAASSLILQELLQLSGPNFAKEAAKLMAKIKPENLINILQQFLNQEKAVLAAEPVFARLAQAHSLVQQLGDKFSAYKAENIAGREQEPAFMFAEVPLRFAGKETSGNLQVFSRHKYSAKAKNWRARVVLDLQMSNLGPILSDLKFLPHRLDIKIGSADENSQQCLQKETEALLSALKKKGFNAQIEFKVLIPDEEKNTHSGQILTVAKQDLTTTPRLDLEV